MSTSQYVSIRDAVRSTSWRGRVARIGSGLAFSVTASCASAAAGATAPDREDGDDEPAVVSAEELAPEPRGERLPPKLRSYLQRPVAYSARHLDHGVLSAALGAGWPHRYRLELSLGILDHLTVGATAHWLPDQPAPNWSPKVSVAFWRSDRFEAGAHYFQSLFPPPEQDDDPTTLSFEKRLHWLLTSASVSNRFASGGFDLGVMRYLDADPSMDPGDDNINPSVWRWSMAGGLHLRAGTRRWGFTFNMLAPAATRFDDFRFLAELVFDVRFGVFEARPKGGWRTGEIVYSTDRRPPPWR